MERYLRSRSVSSDYASHLRVTCRRCRVMSVEAINRYLRKRLTEVQSVTVATERAILLGVWKWAYEAGIVDNLPRGIVKVKIIRRPTRAWTLEQCCTAVKGTFALTKRIRPSGAPMGLFLRAFLLLGYESGARLGDLWAFRREDFDGDTLRWTQHKTAEPVVKLLSPACIEAVTALLALSPDGRLFGWIVSKKSVRRILQTYLKSIGLPGSAKWLRRSGCTHIEIENPGKGRLHLGHRTVGLAEKSYIDWSQVRRDIPATPSLLK